MGRRDFGASPLGCEAPPVPGGESDESIVDTPRRAIDASHERYNVVIAHSGDRNRSATALGCASRSRR
jgi:hypothetical protein